MIGEIVVFALEILFGGLIEGLTERAGSPRVRRLRGLGWTALGLTCLSFAAAYLGRNHALAGDVFLIAGLGLLVLTIGFSVATTVVASRDAPTESRRQSATDPADRPAPVSGATVPAGAVVSATGSDRRR